MKIVNDLTGHFGSELVIPRLASEPTVVSGSDNGFIYYDTTDDEFKFRRANSWERALTEADLTDLNDADTLDGIDSSQFLRSDTSDSFTSGTLTMGAGTTLTASGATAVTVPNSTGATNALNTGTADARYLGITAKAADADKLDNLDSLYFLDSSNQSAGTLPTGRLTGSYTGITGVGTIATGTWSATAIAANKGGTGQTVYAVGDLLYASTTTALSKLADVATGSALISGGVGVAPSWGKIGLTTHVSGTLGAANGGTGIASYTTGNYINASGATTLQQRTPAQVLSDIGAASSSHTHTLAALTDTTITTPVSGNLLRYNGSAWVNYADSNYATSGHSHAATDATTLDGLDSTQFLRSDVADSLNYAGGVLSIDDTQFLLYTGNGGQTWINYLDSGYNYFTHTASTAATQFRSYNGSTYTVMASIDDDGLSVKTGRIEANTGVPIVGGAPAGTLTALNVASLDSGNSTETGAIVVKVNANSSAEMSKIRVQGFLYNSTYGNNLDVTTSGYLRADGQGFLHGVAYISTGSRHPGNPATGGANVTAVRLAQETSTGNTVLIIGDSTSVWNYPKIQVVVEAMGHSALSSQLQGWTIAIESDLSGYDTVTTVSEGLSYDWHRQELKLNSSNTVWHSGNDGAASTLDADLLDGQHGSYYQDSSNQNAGTLPTGRLTGSYTGITGLGTVTAGTWNGTAIAANYGGTGITSYTTGNYINAASGTTLQQRTPAQVLSDIGAASSSHTHTLAALTDTTITSPVTGNVLRYNGTAWVNYADSNYAASSHNHDTSNITTGTFVSARLSGSYTGVTGVGTLTAGTWNATAIGATYGGTGQTVYAVGDILFASTTTALSKLAGVATGNALISGGVGVAPSWGKIGLTTHVTGTLGAANGGTGIASYTTGNYINASGATTLQQRTPAQVLSDIGAASSSHTHTLAALTDTTITTPVTGNVLRYNGTVWVNYADSNYATSGHTHAGGGDADTLDTLDSTQFLRSDATDNYTSGTLTFDAGTTLAAAGATAVTVPNSTGTTNALNTGTADARFLGITATAADSSLLNGQAGSYYQNADNLSAGTVPSARMTGSYTGITGLGTVTAGTWSATTIAANKGGTGLTSYTTGYYINAASASTLQQRSPAQVLSDIGAASSSHTHTLAALTDTTITTPATGNVLRYNGSVWVNYADSNYAASSHNHDTSNITTGTFVSARLSGSYTGVTGVGTLTAGTWNATAIAANYGGTGQTSYAVGDLLYASTTSALSKLAGVATGNALISGGVSTAPSWGKIGLTTHVTGTLGAANGGTGIASYTTGNYINASGATTLQQRTPAQVLSDIGAASSSHTHTLAALTDTTITTPVTGNVLRYNGTVWVNYADSNYATSGHTHAGGGDADTLDTLDSTQFLRSDTSDSFTSGTLTMDAGTTLAAAGATAVTVPNSTGSTNALNTGTADARYLGITAKAADSDLLDGLDSLYFRDAGNLNAGVLLSARLSGSYTGVTGLGTVTTGTWSATTILANRGGTGFASYAVGDILYANTTTTLAKLADVATGNVLISGGVNVAPSWGKVALTTHVSGTLGATNGGTGIASYTAGNYINAAGGNTLQQRTPAQVRTDIDAAQTSHTHSGGGTSTVMLLMGG